MKKKSFLFSIKLAILFSTLLILINCNSNNNETGTTNMSTPQDSIKKMLARGDYLVNHVSRCLTCHSQRNYNQFSGPIVPGTEGMGGEEFGKNYHVQGIVYARNITPDTVNGIGSWTDEEIARAITRGISKNGDTLYRMMPFAHFNQMSKDDVYSIIAYLRTLKPNNNKVPARKLEVKASAVYPVLKSSSLEANVKPDVMEMAKYGGYLVASAACMDCHTPMKNGEYEQDKLFSGGLQFNMGSFVANSANLTPDSATGIGSWSEQMFLDKFKLYRDPAVYSANPGRNNSVMPWTAFTNMDDFDIKAIYKYLRTLPPVKNLVVKYPQ
ncbi:MAG: c-type cytochrome [Ferruginibacter sp.]